MYTAFYGLREKPFALSPDPRFLYLAGSHREALAHLLYGIEQGEGFISVTGEVGTGKTTLCRTLLERLDGDTELAFLFNPSKSALELLQSICSEFGLPAEGLARRALMSQLNAFLVEKKREGRRVLLIIDEAQTLTENTLEQVRLLSNLETSREKLIQILLLGQPELDRKLDGQGLRQLRQRISVRWQLEPLGPQETRAYVRHRLSVAAGEPKELFSDAALREVHRRTGGIPRLVNQLCDRALLGGYAARAAQIGPSLIRAAAKEIPDATRRRSTGPISGGLLLRPWMMVAASLSIVGLALFAGLQVGRHGLTDAMSASLFRPAGPPPVGANAPTTAGAKTVEGDESPSMARLIGYVPGEIRAGTNPGETLDGAQASDERAFSSDTAVASELLPQLIAIREPLSALADGQAILIERFSLGSATGVPASAEDLEAELEAKGLEITRFEGGSIDLLRRLDHPVLLPVVASNASGGPEAASERLAESRWLTLIGFDGNRARLAGLLNEEIVTVPIDSLTQHWLEAGLIVWQRFEQVPSVMNPGDQGAGVLWLQGALKELHYLDGNELDGKESSVFDPATSNALVRFQNDRGLVANGVAGPLTQIALYAQLDRYPIPRLSRSARAAAGSSGSREDIPSEPPTGVRSDATPRPGDRG